MDLRSPDPSARGTVEDRRRAVAVRWLGLALGLAGFALLCRPYLGLSGDARVYIGRALANLDPTGVGADLMYVGDGQSAFSVFPTLLTWVVSALGAEVSSAVVSLAGVVIWAAAAALLLRTWNRGLPVWLQVAAVLLLPGAYAGLGLRFGEAMATPRPFAEALVLTALWALLVDRRLLCGLLLLGATALHPIMALPGWGVWFALEAWNRPRLLMLPAVSAIAIVVGAVLNPPLLGRVVQGMDQDWATVLHRTAPYLFVGDWSAATWGRTLVQATTVGLGAALLQGRARALLLAALAVCGLALLAALALGDGLHSVLVLQMQPWRCLWLLAFFAAASFPLVALELWRQGAAGRLGAAFLAMAWLSLDVPAPAIVACACLFGLHAAARAGWRLHPWLLTIGWVVALSTGLLIAGAQAVALWSLASGEAYSAPVPPNVLALLDVNRTLLAAALLVGFSLLRQARAPSLAVTAMGVGCVLVGALCWDARDATRRAIGDDDAATAFQKALAVRPGPILWLEGDVQPWTWAGRSGWWSYLQSSSNVFSRSQAIEWSRRARRLLETGVGPPSLMDRFPHNPSNVLWIPSEEAVRTFCRDADAPAWIVAPHLAGDFDHRRDAATIVVTKRAEPMLDDRTHRIVQIDRYALLPCRETGPFQGR